jgi:hypothetical protein
VLWLAPSPGFDADGGRFFGSHPRPAYGAEKLAPSDFKIRGLKPLACVELWRVARVP